MNTTARKTREVDNTIYESFGELWYNATDHPLGLLRAQTKPLVDWVLDQLPRQHEWNTTRVLDLGCGGGLISNALANRGLRVTGVDASPRSLEVATHHDATRSVGYVVGDARELPCADASFDVVTAMDFLEHVDQPRQVLAEAARVLQPGGLFLFHTFNRNLAAWLIVIKGVEWFVKNTPPRMHALELFLKPSEMRRMCRDQGLAVRALHGFGPKVFSREFLRLLTTGSVPSGLSFGVQRSTLISYIGVCVKETPGAR